MKIIQRLLLAPAMLGGLLALGVITFFLVLFGRERRRTEILRGMSRTLSGCFDGNGDVTYSAWSYWMALRGKEWGPRRVAFVDAVNRSKGHCRRAYEWHEAHKLFDETIGGKVD